MRFREFPRLSVIADIIITTDSASLDQVHEGRWISGRFDRNIRIDPASYGAGQTHGRILGRNGAELGAVNIDGSSSHGTKMVLHGSDADALRQRGFDIRPGNIVEWFALSEQPLLLFG